MRCPNCEEQVKDDAKVCYSCGEDLKDYAVDSLIQGMIDEDTQNSNESKKVKKGMDTVIKEEKEKIAYGQAFKVTAIASVLMYKYISC
jgi:hypothetical protein